MSGRDDWKYERYRLGELSPGEKLALESEPDFDTRMAEFDESDAEIFARYPAGEMADLIAERARTAGEGDSSDADEVPGESDSYAKILRFPAARYLAPLAAAAAILAALIVVFPLRSPDTPEDGTETLRPKGLDIPDSLSTPELVLYRDGPEGVEKLRNGDEAREHDLLQVGFMSGSNWWGGILSVDGNGVITRHWPLEGDRSVALGHSGEYLLPFSYELDDAPDFEAFFLVWSDAEFDLRGIESLLSSYRSGNPHPEVKSVNPDGKTGLTVIQIDKAP